MTFMQDWIEQLRQRNQQQLETIRNYNGLSPDRDTGLVKGKLILLLIFTLVLTVSDGILTIQLLNLGAWEANPFMRYALSHSVGFFIIIKYLLTAGGLLVLLRFGQVCIFRESITLEELAVGILLFYQGLVLYEIECYLILR